jgi:flagellar FliL protein
MATVTQAPPTEETEDGPKKSKKKLIIIVVLVLALAGGGYFMFLKPKGPAVVPPPEPGAVLKLDPITLNLADGRYLKLGLALQFTVEAGAGGGHGGAEPDGSHALDLAIAQLSNRKITELNSAEAREKAKEELKKAVEKAYHEAVMDVYFTEFVMQ